MCLVPYVLWYFTCSRASQISCSLCFDASLAFMPYVSCALVSLASYALNALAPHVPCALCALVPCVSCSFCALEPHMLHTPCTLVSHMLSCYKCPSYRMPCILHANITFSVFVFPCFT